MFEIQYLIRLLNILQHQKILQQHHQKKKQRILWDQFVVYSREVAKTYLR